MEQQLIRLHEMKRLSIIWGFIMISLFIALTTFGFYYKKKSTNYKNYEKELAIKVTEYAEKESFIAEDIKFSLEELVERGVLENNIIEGKECRGYVKKIENEFKTFIDCGFYKTHKYSKFE